MSEFFIHQKKADDLWYKEPWMLLVLGGPLIVVIAALITVFIAWHGADQVVSKDYYKQGININKDIYRDAKALEYKMQAKLQANKTDGKIALQLKGQTELPTTVYLSISSASNNSEFETIQKITLSRVQAGSYEGQLKTQDSSDAMNLKLWHVQIEANDWRLTDDWHDPLQTTKQIQ